MLWISVGIGFLLLFGVLISDGISSGAAGATDVSSRPRKQKAAAATPPEAASAIETPRTIGARRRGDGADLAA